MNISKVIHQTKVSKWQPTMTFSNNLMEVAECINFGHEDYGILIDMTAFIIKTLIAENKTTFYWEDICKIQVDLYDKKKELVFLEKEKYHAMVANNAKGKRKQFKHVSRLLRLPNQNINLGKRLKFVKVGEWKPPSTLYLDILLNNILPVSVTEIGTKSFKNIITDYDINLLNWYKLFETIHPLEDLNGRTGGIVVAVLSYLKYGYFLTPPKVNSKGKNILTKLNIPYTASKQEVYF